MKTGLASSLSTAAPLLAATPLVAGGPNLLRNPTFNTDATWWTGVLSTWNATDANGAPASGSLRTIYPPGNPDEIANLQCVQAAPGPYVERASVFVNGTPDDYAAHYKAGSQEGFGTAVPFADESGSFWFFAPTNIELDAKVLNACALNGRYWFFAAGAHQREGGYRGDRHQDRGDEGLPQRLQPRVLDHHRYLGVRDLPLTTSIRSCRLDR